MTLLELSFFQWQQYSSILLPLEIGKAGINIILNDIIDPRFGFDDLIEDEVI